MQSIIIFFVLSILSSLIVTNFINLTIKKNAKDFSIREYIQNFKVRNIDFKLVIIFFILFKIIINDVSLISIITIVPCIISLILAFILDIRFMIIPDTSSVLIIISAFFNIIINYNKTLLIDSIVGFLIGGITLFIIDYIFKKITKNDGFGYGDMKILASIGLYVGYKSIIVIMILSIVISAIFSVIYLVSKKTRELKNAYIPFGPFIVVSTFIILVIPATQIINFYFYLMEMLVNRFIWAVIYKI